MKKSIKISLDLITGKTVTNSDNIVRGDTLAIDLKFYESGVPLIVTGQDITLTLTKPDGTIIEEILYGAGSVATIELTENSTASIGIVQGEIQCEDDQGTAIFNQFTYQVKKSISTQVIEASTSTIVQLAQINALIDEYQTKDDLLVAENIKADTNIPLITTQNNNAATNTTNLNTANTNATNNIEAMQAIPTVNEIQTARGAFGNLGARLNDSDTQLSENIQQLNGEHYLTYKSVAGSISNTFTITNEAISACERMGTDICVCPMVSIADANDYTIDMLPNAAITECLDRITASTINPIMIKPHIGLNFQDNFNRKYYIPSDIGAFFTNWTNILLNYATMCDTYNIPLLCVSVEMVELTNNIYASYWETLYNTIKLAHPNVLIIHAPKVWEFNDDTHEESLQWVDILGCTFYTNYTYKSFVGNTADVLEDVGKAFYCNEGFFVKKLNDRCSKYNKKFYIAEIGCMPLEDGLIDVVPQSFTEGGAVTNYYVQSALMEGFFKYLCNNSNVVGFSWWHLRDPFEIYSNSETLPGEAMMTKYIKGGLI